MPANLIPRTDASHSTAPNARTTRKKQRAPWRQILVEAERGFALGVRGDSSFFVHFFLCSVVLAAAVVFGLSLLEWTVLILALTMVLSAQMFNQVLKTLLQNNEASLPSSTQQTLRIGTAAVFVSIAGAVVVIGLLFGQRLVEIISDQTSTALL